MKELDVTICLNESMHDATCRITEARLVRYLGSKEVEVEVEVLTINTLPASYYAPEVIEDVASQCRNDVWVLAEAADMARVDAWGNEADLAYDRARDRAMGCF